MVTLHEPDRDGRPWASLTALAWVLVFVAGTLLLSAPAILNRVAFFFADSGAYVSGGQAALAEFWKLLPGGLAETLAAPGGMGTPNPDTHLEAAEAPPFRPGPDAPGEPTIKGRSVYYAIFAYLGLLAGGLWSVVFVQALALFWLVTLLCRRAFPASWPGPALAAAAGLAFLTPAGLFAGMIMPDIWAGLLILATALLATSWTGLGRLERLLLLGFVLFSVLSHLSHLLLLAALLLGLAALLPFRTRIGISGPPLAFMALCVGLGIAGDLAFSAAVERVTGAPPISRPHLTAHLVDDGPGVDYLRAACPAAGFAVCAYADRLPMHWTRFLFGRTAEGAVFQAASPEIKRALAAEDKAFALAVARFRPAETATFLLADGIDQAGRFAVDRVPATPHGLPAEVAEASRRSPAMTEPRLLAALTTSSYATAVLGIVLFGAGASAAAAGRPGARDGLLVIAAIAILGVLINAAICGILASPEGRFQARVVWIVPLVGSLLYFSRRARRPGSGPTSSERFS